MQLLDILITILIEINLIFFIISSFFSIKTRVVDKIITLYSKI